MARRSVLFSPGDSPELLRKAPQTDADVLVFDLEDAVVPGRKAEARSAVAEVLSDPDFDPAAEVLVRVNAGEAAAADLDALPADARVDGVVVPKVSGVSDVVRVERLSGSRDLPIFALIETATGVLSAATVAETDGVSALIFGAEDLAADLGAERTAEGTEVLYARQHVLLSARAAHVDAIDTVYTDYGDADGLREDAAFARRLGYDGKLAIHPSQVQIINEAYTPDADRVAWARRVLAAREEAETAGRGVFSVDGEMIDAPLVAQAERIVARADVSFED